MLQLAEFLGSAPLLAAVAAALPARLTPGHAAQLIAGREDWEESAVSPDDSPAPSSADVPFVGILGEVESKFQIILHLWRARSWLYQTLFVISLSFHIRSRTQIEQHLYLPVCSSQPICASKFLFCNIFQNLQLLLSGEKKVRALLFSRKKKFGGEGGRSNLSTG